MPLCISDSSHSDDVLTQSTNVTQPSSADVIQPSFATNDGNNDNDTEVEESKGGRGDDSAAESNGASLARETQSSAGDNLATGDVAISNKHITIDLTQ